MRLIKTMMMQCFLVLALAGLSIPPSTAGTTIYVPGPPPAPKIFVKPAPPSALHIWIPGRWAWISGKWTWHQGHWVKPPHRGARWVPGHWKKRHRGWVWVPGHWARHRR